jgi:hypothetical protein
MTVSTEAVLNSPTASQSATVAAPVRKPADTHLPDYADYGTWLRQLEKNNFPEFITITVLVESDEANPYREGSRDAAPVAKMIMDWMGGVALVSAPSVVPPPGVVGE